MATVGRPGGPRVPFATPATSVDGPPVDDAAPGKRLREVDRRDVDAMLAARAPTAVAPKRGLIARLLERLRGPGATNEADFGALARDPKRLAVQIHLALSVGARSQEDVATLATVFGRVEEVLGLQDPAVLARLPKETRERLELTLFGPLNELREPLARALRDVPARLAVAESLAVTTTRHEVAAGAPFELTAAGNVETRGIETFEVGPVRAAAFTHKGIGYATYNEDALSIRVTPSADGKTLRLSAVVADQAGGMGKLAQSGGASLAAVQTWQAGLQADRSPADALLDANRAVVKANFAESASSMSTLSGLDLSIDLQTGAVAAGQTVSVGDTQVLHYGRDGTLKSRTAMDNHGESVAKRGDPTRGLDYANVIFNCLGDESPISAHRANVEAVAPGDYFVLISDGVGDMNLRAQREASARGRPWSQWHLETTERQIGGFLAAAKSPEEGCRAIIDQAFAHVRSGDGKPDNTTCVVFQVGGEVTPAPRAA